MELTIIIGGFIILSAIFAAVLVKLLPDPDYNTVNFVSAFIVNMILLLVLLVILYLITGNYYIK